MAAGKRDRRRHASIEQSRHLVFAVERCLIQRRQTDGVLEIQIGPEIDQRGEGRRLLLDDREVQRRAAVIGPIHALVQIGARLRQRANRRRLAQGDGGEQRVPGAVRKEVPRDFRDGCA